jgi:hypothetical protein
MSRRASIESSVLFFWVRFKMSPHAAGKLDELRVPRFSNFASDALWAGIDRFERGLEIAACEEPGGVLEGW